MRKVCGLIIVLLLVAACAGGPTPIKQITLPECHAIYDAGSTGTRLFIYYEKNGDWIEQPGPEAKALTEANSVPEIVNLLEDIKTNSNADKAFDWALECNRLSTIQVLATAGMRLVEKTDPLKSVNIWKDLNDALRVSYASKVSEISTKTITGYEEGLYAWLAVKEWREKNEIMGTDFGLAEMGGASSQVIFPCGANCVNAKTIVVDNQKMKFFIHSFLKLGTTQVPASLQSSATMPPACEWGIAEKPGWQKKLCVNSIKPKLVDASGAIKDPNLNSFVSIPKHNHLTKWYLTGSFAYMDADRNGDVHSCCEHRRGKYDGCYEEKNSCYLAVYQPLYLEALGIKKIKDAKLSKTSWTMGAAICTVGGCLQKITVPRACQWMAASKCLPEPVTATP